MFFGRAPPTPTSCLCHTGSVQSGRGSAPARGWRPAPQRLASVASPPHPVALPRCSADSAALWAPPHPPPLPLLPPASGVAAGRTGLDEQAPAGSRHRTTPPTPPLPAPAGRAAAQGGLGLPPSLATPLPPFPLSPSPLLLAGGWGEDASPSPAGRRADGAGGPAGRVGGMCSSPPAEGWGMRAGGGGGGGRGWIRRVRPAAARGGRLLSPATAGVGSGRGRAGHWQGRLRQPGGGGVGAPRAPLRGRTAAPRGCC